jgi:hypothetical protein
VCDVCDECAVFEICVKSRPFRDVSDIGRQLSVFNDRDSKEIWPLCTDELCAPYIAPQNERTKRWKTDLEYIVSTSEGLKEKMVLQNVDVDTVSYNDMKVLFDRDDPDLEEIMDFTKEMIRDILTWFRGTVNEYRLVHSYAPTHSYTHAYTHIHIHTYTHTHLHSYTPTLIHSYTPTHIHSCTHVLMYSYTHTLIHSYTHIHLHSYTPTHIHSYTHTHILLHTYIPTLMCAG